MKKKNLLGLVIVSTLSLSGCELLGALESFNSELSAIDSELNSIIDEAESSAKQENSTVA